MLTITNERGVRERYKQGICAAASAAVFALYITHQDTMTEDRSTIISTERICALTIGIASLNLPRRPAVYENGRLVDQQNGASIVSLLSFSWYPLYQRRFSGLDNVHLDDLPITPLTQRIRTLQRNFAQCASGDMLLSRLAWAWGYSFSMQWGVTLIHSVSQFAGQYLLQRLLSCLERPLAQQQPAMGYAVCLGLALLSENMSAGWITWVTQARLSIPMTAFLKGLLFDKMTKKQSSQQAELKTTKRIDERKNVLSLESLMSNDW